MRCPIRVEVPDLSRSSQSSPSVPRNPRGAVEPLDDGRDGGAGVIGGISTETGCVRKGLWKQA